jgi:hypothetical protein
MLIYVLEFPKNYWPRRIAYKSYGQAVRMCGNFNISRKKIRILYLEEDENRNSFGQVKSILE